MNAVSKINENSVEARVVRDAPPLAPAVAQVPEVAALPKRRRGGRFLLMAALPLALIAAGGYFWVTGGRYQETENANLRQAKVAIASEVAGRVVEVAVADNKTVKAGDVLFKIDPEPYRIALDQADASLAAAKLSVEQLRAAFSQAVAQERAAANESEFAQQEFDRQSALVAKAIASRSALDEARRNLSKAGEEQASAEQGIVSARAALGGDPDMDAAKHPTVLQATAARDKAAFDLAQTVVRAPADGMVSQASSFKTGQYVMAGTPLFSLVEAGDTWVEANFKETQLTRMKLGQSAEIVLDTYPGKPLRATVESIGAGTGAEFSLLPAQNATGNWVKVTQRIPVRLKVDGAHADVALRTGMSASVSVDTGTRRGFGSLLGIANAADE
jgi:membrane fusion protein (multidrug efflux system)